MDDDLLPADNRGQSSITRITLKLERLGVNRQHKPLLEWLLAQFLNKWESNLGSSGRGQAETDETLQVKGHPRVFAVSDSSGLRDPTGKVLPQHRN
ncbi:alternative NAD(P)H-ubiquinone oxidoreductase C1 [Artemisia annua]|uniref:Alternative NAD(P)H-ubiquinone oxidoreductase C1 n=1 Tax=Artemisia annua TaxID=35608 RepID=A0A2U1NWL4_ARTAN|nr:alternative NAD(P)H-ubiquinone oxidoreductase C1 [Artemisia annua]